jgi:predicted MFS family arabinose efflux permease
VSGSTTGTPGWRTTWGPWAFALVFLLWQVSFQFVYGFLADPIQKEFDLTGFEAATLISAFLLTYGLMQVPAGILLDRVGVRRVLPLAGVGAGLSVGAFGLASDFGELLGARIAAGAFMAFAFPAMGKIARRQLPPGRFVLAMALADMSFGGGAVLVAGVTEFVDGSAWRELVQVQAVLGLILAAALWLALRPMSGGRAKGLETDAIGSSLRRALRRRSTLQGALLYAWGAGLTFGFGGYWNLKLEKACGCSAPQVSEHSTALFGGLALGMLIAGLLGDRSSRWRPALLGASISSVALVVALLLGSGPLPFLAVGILNFALGMTLGTCALAFAVAARDISTKEAATVVAIVNAAGCISGAFFGELPIWMGDGQASVFTVGVVYVGVALLGVGASWSLPPRRLATPS